MTDARVDEMVKRLREISPYYSQEQALVIMLQAAELMESLAESAERVRELETRAQRDLEIITDRQEKATEETKKRLSAERKLAEAQKDAVIAWSVCASIHREFCKGRDPLFKQRQADFVKHEKDALYALSGAAPEEKKQ